MKKVLIINLLFLCAVGIAPRDNISIWVSELCDLEGYVILDCTYTERKGFDNNMPEDLVKLENGMTFRVNGYLSYLSSGRAVVFARSIKFNNEDTLIYKLYIDDKDRIYSAYRIR